MTTEEDVRRICLSLPATTEKPSYGTPGFRVKDRLFARIREDSNELAIYRPSVEEKEALIASDPVKFFQTPHYEGYPMVLVRLAAVDCAELAELLTEAWMLRAPARLAAALEASRR